MPISPNLALAFWCPSIVEMVVKTRDQAQGLVKTLATASLLGVGRDADIARRNLPEIRARLTKAQADLDDIESGTPLMLSTDNIRYVNSLQIAQSEHYIVSANGDFSFVKEMISDNVSHRQGHRHRFS